MGVHKLQLEVPNTLIPCVMRVIDMSVYDSNIVTSCPRLRISSPGFSQSYFVDDIEPGFDLRLTACDLKIQTSQCGTQFNDLPDRIYVITYSVAPHDKVYVEYQHLRITKALLKIQALYCELDLGACEPGPELKKKLAELTEIENYFHAAKAKVEVCRKAQQGRDMYGYAWDRLQKLNCVNCK